MLLNAPCCPYLAHLRYFVLQQCAFKAVCNQHAEVSFIYMYSCDLGKLTTRYIVWSFLDVLFSAHLTT